jgi:hypothetical protein
MTVSEIDMEFGFKVVIDYDDWDNNPRENYDNLSTMVCAHRRYDLGDIQLKVDGERNLKDDIADVVAENGEIEWLPLFLFDHSGISMSTSSDSFSAFDAPGWDWGVVGFIYVTHEKIKEEYSELNESTIKIAREVMVGEVEEYDKYLRGEIYSFVVESPDGKNVESCGGIYEIEDAEREGKEVADYYIEKLRSQKKSNDIFLFSEVA